MPHNVIIQTYPQLLELYGPRGWWPLSACNGYHPNDYSFPKTASQRFEICVGAILTQNTAWTSVETALDNLSQLHALTPAALLACDDQVLKTAIRSTGYYNQKSAYLKTMAAFFHDCKARTPTREELLQLRGVGEETADSILLYAYQQPFFVIDAYTRRVFTHLGVNEGKESYRVVQKRFHDALEPLYQGQERILVYQEYHALIVEHAKRNHSGKQKQ
ncbi:MAG: endonuclease III domain-containing protein [Kiritimatiellae bacterium]|nr:endonuclease III domain-containing protein [Kiritimatiellia bacterium]